MRYPLTLVCLLLAVAGLATPAVGDDNAQLNAIYRQFFVSPVDTAEVATTYREDIIHVGLPGNPLVRGKPDFLATNIEPMAQLVNSGAVELEGRAYVVRRLVIGDMANDVGYLYIKARQPGGDPTEQLQKFSWVFVREECKWRVATDFDATPASLSALDGLEAAYVVE